MILPSLQGGNDSPVYWLFNDLSFTEQYPDVETFCNELRELLRLRAISDAVRQRLLCSRSLYERPVTPSSSFREAIYRSRDRDFKVQAISWAVNYGPFWEDDRASQQDDYFQYEDQDVTEQGLGEAARRILVGKPSAAYSMVGGRYCFTLTPLLVQHGLTESPLGSIEVPNTYKLRELRHEAESVVSPRNWDEFLAYSRQSFTQLIILDIVDAPLSRYPFSEGIAERVTGLLEILDSLVSSRDQKGTYTGETNELIRKHFQGATAKFSDESETNKNKFTSKLTFRDKDTGQDLFCSWHGKIAIQDFRIHFNWPLTPKDTKLKVVYIGPKITKK